MLQDYFLSLDGPLLRRQRELLIALIDDARNGLHVQLSAEKVKLLEGLVELTDAIADQAHDHGIDCLIEEPIVETSPQQPGEHHAQYRNREALHRGGV